MIIYKFIIIYNNIQNIIKIKNENQLFWHIARYINGIIWNENI